MSMSPSEVTIKFYSDAGHGWGAVKRGLIDTLGIADKISGYSYQNGNTVYLEEDLDLTTLIDTLVLFGTTSIKFIKNHTNGRSPIRSYDRFSA
jgi:hypothetical protein